MSSPPICQVALCTTDPARSVRVLSVGLGFADAGARFHWGPGLAQVQAIGTDATCTIGWLVGRQDFFQFEIFHHSEPTQKPLGPDARPSDFGWSRVGVAVPDFDAALERLAGLGVGTLTRPLARDGLRRVCFHEPGSRVVIEVMEDGEAIPGGIRPRFYDLAPALVYVAISVPDLAVARSFFVDAIGLSEAPATLVHLPEHESLWQLDGARVERAVVCTGDAFLELDQYREPVGRPHPADYLPSDQGFMNAAFGFRDQAPLDAVFARLTDAGFVANRACPQTVGSTYVNDGLRNTAELLICPRELDDSFGFEPRPPIFRAMSWPRAAAPPAGAPSGEQAQSTKGTAT